LVDCGINGHHLPAGQQRALATRDVDAATTAGRLIDTRGVAVARADAVCVAPIHIDTLGVTAAG